MFLRMSAAKAVRWADGWTFDVNVWNHLGNKAVAPASSCNHAQSGYQVLFRRCNQRGEKRSYPCGHHFGGERNNCFGIQADGVHVLTAVTIYLEINEARGKPGVILLFALFNRTDDPVFDPHRERLSIVGISSREYL